eukprot:SAG31_NODE_3199_length_4564_cov_18.467861_5_plen_103_part_00
MQSLETVCANAVLTLVLPSQAKKWASAAFRSDGYALDAIARAASWAASTENDLLGTVECLSGDDLEDDLEDEEISSIVLQASEVQPRPKYARFDFSELERYE